MLGVQTAAHVFPFAMAARSFTVCCLVEGRTTAVGRNYSQHVANPMPQSPPPLTFFGWLDLVI